MDWLLSLELFHNCDNSIKCRLLFIWNTLGWEGSFGFLIEVHYLENPTTLPFCIEIVEINYKFWMSLSILQTFIAYFVFNREVQQENTFSHSLAFLQSFRLKLSRDWNIWTARVSRKVKGFEALLRVQESGTKKQTKTDSCCEMFCFTECFMKNKIL